MAQGITRSHFVARPNMFVRSSYVYLGDDNPSVLLRVLRVGQ